jgi:hypothetical protein
MRALISDSRVTLKWGVTAGVRADALTIPQLDTTLHDRLLMYSTALKFRSDAAFR